MVGVVVSQPYNGCVVVIHPYNGCVVAIQALVLRMFENFAEHFFFYTLFFIRHRDRCPVATLFRFEARVRILNSKSALILVR